jgi:hypothetical protein
MYAGIRDRYNLPAAKLFHVDNHADVTAIPDGTVRQVMNFNGAHHTVLTFWRDMAAFICDCRALRDVFLQGQQPGSHGSQRGSTDGDSEADLVE